MTRDPKLMLLQLRQVVYHEGVLEVRLDHRLEQVHVPSGELSETLVHQATKLAVSLDLSIEDVLDVVLTLVEVLDDFAEVLIEKVLVLVQLLVAHQLLDLALVWLDLLLHQ